MRLRIRSIYMVPFLWMILIQLNYGLPKIPESERILTSKEVKNFWMNKIVHSYHSSFPRKPSGLYPKEQAAWKSALREQNQLLSDIRAGLYDEEARIAQLKHNSNAWRLKGKDEEANKLDEELRKIQLFRAQLETLELQRKAVQNQVELNEKIGELNRQIAEWSRCCP